jgi:hypothetical protein
MNVEVLHIHAGNLGARELHTHTHTHTHTTHNTHTHTHTERKCEAKVLA